MPLTETFMGVSVPFVDIFGIDDSVPFLGVEDGLDA